MVRVITVDDVSTLIRKVTIEAFFSQLIERLRQDYARWNAFQKVPRHASHVKNGVIELMPTLDQDYYAFKYVNGHPNNPGRNKQTVVAAGMLADVESGYPVLMSEMTLLTAFRTAATSALASDYLARKNSRVFGIIGTGAQAEFQALAHKAALGIEVVKYFDLDPAAMRKFADNLSAFDLSLEPCSSAEEVVLGSDIVTTATAAKKRDAVVQDAWVEPGVHINGVGGDCPGKTELDPATLSRAKIVVELPEQTHIEGEIQGLGLDCVHALLWELAAGEKRGRENDAEITLFDSVGFAIEDYSVLRLIYTLAEDFHVGHCLDMIPDVSDPKDLFGVLR